MGKKVVIISTSLRKNSNSDALAREFMRGALEVGNEVEYISLRGKKIAFCTGCMSCAKTGECAIRDDAVAIEKQVASADVVVWATPIYYYEMSGQMKTLIDRLNPLYPKELKFRDVYVLTTAQENAPTTSKTAEAGVQAWVDNFKQARFAGSLFCGGVDGEGEIAGNSMLAEAYQMGRDC